MYKTFNRCLSSYFFSYFCYFNHGHNNLLLLKTIYENVFPNANNDFGVFDSIRNDKRNVENASKPESVWTNASSVSDKDGDMPIVHLQKPYGAKYMHSNTTQANIQMREHSCSNISGNSYSRDCRDKTENFTESGFPGYHLMGQFYVMKQA